MIETLQDRLKGTGSEQLIPIAIFASGAGSNAQKIIYHFTSSPSRGGKKVKVALIVSNNPEAGVLQIAEREKIPKLIIERNRFKTDGYLPELKKYQIEFIVLAGFMWKVPPELLLAFPDKIINIHPALLPK